jgi:WD40 repeat protein
LFRIPELTLLLVIGLAAIAPAALSQTPGTTPPRQPAGRKPIEVKLPTRKQPVSYAREIEEILQNKCAGCHGSVLAENRLSLESVADMLKGGKRGPAVVRGKADTSLLFRMAAHQVEPVMPPKDKPVNKPLTPEELGLIKLWIDAGAHDDSAEAGEPRDDRTRKITLGDLPPGVNPINALDLTGDGARVAVGRANAVQVYDVDSGLDIISLGGHKDLIQSLRFNPAGTMLAAGSYQVVTIWTAPTGRLEKSLLAHAGPVTAFVVAADGATGYSGSDDKSIRVWNLSDGKLLRTLLQPAPVRALALFPGGTTLATGSADGVVRCLDVTDGRARITLKGHKAAVSDVAVFASGSDGQRLVSASEDGSVRIWLLVPDSQAAGGKTQAKPPETKMTVLNGHKGPVRAIELLPDGETIISGGDDGTVRIWNARTGTQSGTLSPGHKGPILALALSPNGNNLLTGSADGTARLITRSGGKVLRTFTGHRGPVRAVAFSPRGDRIATGDALGGLKVWETATGQGVIAFGHVAPSGAAIQPIQTVAFRTDGELVSASADTTLKVWSFAGSWREQRTLDSHVFRVLALDFSPDGGLLAVGGGEPSRTGEVKLWQIDKGLLGQSLPSLHSDTVFAVRFSPDGSRLASASADKFLKVTSVPQGKLLRSFEGHTHHVMAVDWKSDGKQLITGGADNVLKVWDFDSGEQIRTLQAAGKQITSVRWITGKPEVIGASGDAQVRMWNPDTDGIARVYSGAGDYVYSVAASADGSRIAAGGADGVLLVWNGQNGQVIRKLEPPKPGTSRQTAHGWRAGQVAAALDFGR